MSTERMELDCSVFGSGLLERHVVAIVKRMVKMQRMSTDEGCIYKRQRRGCRETEGKEAFAPLASLASRGTVEKRILRRKAQPRREGRSKGRASNGT